MDLRTARKSFIYAIMSDLFPSLRLTCILACGALASCILLSGLGAYRYFYFLDLLV